MIYDSKDVVSNSYDKEIYKLRFDISQLNNKPYYK